MEASIGSLDVLNILKLKDAEIERLNHKIAELNKEIIDLTGDPEAPARVDLLIENHDLKKKLKKAKEFIKIMQSQTADLTEVLK